LRAVDVCEMAMLSELQLTSLLSDRQEDVPGDEDEALGCLDALDKDGECAVVVDFASR